MIFIDYRVPSPLIYYYRTWKHKDLPSENWIVLKRDWLARRRGFGRIRQHIGQERKHDDEIPKERSLSHTVIK